MAWEIIVDKRMNQGYQGHAELAEWEFTVPLPEQVGAQWIANRIVNAHIEELANQNSQLLELRVWEDTSPFWTTIYRVRIVATASPLFWPVIIIGVLAILVIAGASFLLLKTEDIIEYIGEKAPGVLPLMAIAGIGIVGLAIILAWRRAT